MRGLAFLIIVAASPAVALAPSFPNRGRAGVVDAANVIPSAAETALNQRVVTWDKATGHQLVVATIPTLGGSDVKTYGYQLGRAWGLGRKGADDGAILLLAMKERKVRIEVGYGLEPVLTDALTGMIIRQAVVPKLKAGDIPGALSSGTDEIMKAVTSAPDRLKPPPTVSLRTRLIWWLVIGVWIVVAMAIGLALPGWRRRWRSRAGVRRPVSASAAGSAIIVPSADVPGASNSSDLSSSSDSGFDSGGGSFGGGGSDSSW